MPIDMALLAELGALVIRVWSRHRGVDAFAPLVKLIAQGGHSNGLLGGKVVLFGGVLLQVKQLDAHVLIPLDELHIAQANNTMRRRPLIAIMRIMPKEGAARSDKSFQSREKGLAVGMLGWSQRL